MARTRTRHRRGNETTAAEIKTIRSLESQLASVKSQLNLEKQKRTQAEAELAYAEQNLETVLSTRGRVTTSKLKRRATSRTSRGTATAILCCNDWHVEGCVSPLSVDGANEFNLKVADQRIQKTWQKTLYLLDFARHISNIRELVVWLGGDLINGTIHEELEESNFLGPAEAVIYIQDHIATGIDLLLRESKVDRFIVATSYGNHGRSTKSAGSPPDTGIAGNGWPTTTWPATTESSRRSSSRSSRATTTGSISRGTMFASIMGMRSAITAALGA